MTYLRFARWLTVVLALVPLLVHSAPAENCKADRLSAYRVTVHTYWSKEKFPKHYPIWRPDPQFSKVIGRTHNKNYVLWRLGTLASKGVKSFSVYGRSEMLDNDTQGRAGVLDEFLVPAIGKGVGKSDAVFFADGNHSKVSLMSRVVPSPDWFIGIDSFDLCVLGKWVDVVTLELDPIDSGSDNGFAFTSPKWETQPQEKIYRITSQFPNHDANSFYYPHLKKLPALATVTFVKMREYDLSQTFFSDGQQGVPEFSLSKEDDASNTVEPVIRTLSPLTTTSAPYYPRGRYDTINTGTKIGEEGSRKQKENDHDLNKIKETYDIKRKPKVKRGPRHCRVTEWTEWSTCSRSCGIGNKSRSRKVLRQARRGGRPCPILMETTWCGSARCANNSRPYFDW